MPALFSFGDSVSHAATGLIATNATATSETPEANAKGRAGTPARQPMPNRVPYRVGPTTLSSERRFWWSPASAPWPSPAAAPACACSGGCGAWARGRGLAAGGAGLEARGEGIAGK
eukprot:scaffold263_cov120-Isochrysis_galbana.AAC.12